MRTGDKTGVSRLQPCRDARVRDPLAAAVSRVVTCGYLQNSNPNPLLDLNLVDRTTKRRLDGAAGAQTFQGNLPAAPPLG